MVSSQYISCGSCDSGYGDMFGNKDNQAKSDHHKHNHKHNHNDSKTTHQ